MSKSKGFTLLELLVVVALVALLIMFLMPMHYGRGRRERANRSVCATRLKALDTASFLYANSNGDKYPIGWRHENGNWEVADTSQVTPEDSFALLVHVDYMPTKIFLCPSVGGEPASDEWELVGLGGRYDGDPGAAAEAYIHYAYQDVGVGDGKNYLPSPDLKGTRPVFADRGQRKDPANGNYQLTGKGGANHPDAPAGQNVIGAAHGVESLYSDSKNDCLVGYINGTLGDNIYSDSIGEDDTYLLSSKAQTGTP